MMTYVNFVKKIMAHISVPIKNEVRHYWGSVQRKLSRAREKERRRKRALGWDGLVKVGSELSHLKHDGEFSARGQVDMFELLDAFLRTCPQYVITRPRLLSVLHHRFGLSVAPMLDTKTTGSVGLSVAEVEGLVGQLRDRQGRGAGQGLNAHYDSALEAAGTSSRLLKERRRKEKETFCTVVVLAVVVVVVVLAAVEHMPIMMLTTTRRAWLVASRRRSE